jgi:protein required for attachment to host cells
MEKTWVVIANASQARIYVRENRHAVQLEHTFSHPESKMKGTELASDRPGHNQSKGNGRGAFTEPSDPKAYEAERFAMEVAQALDRGRNSRAFQKIVLVASPHFHGLLNKHINKHVAELVSEHVDKDLTGVPDHEMAAKLNEYIS